MASLESAGYVYNPFTTNDIWGNQSPLNLQPVRERALRPSSDNGALPPAPAMDIHQGSGQKNVRPATRKETEVQFNMVKTGILVAVLVAAFLL